MIKGKSTREEEKVDKASSKKYLFSCRWKSSCFMLNANIIFVRAIVNFCCNYSYPASNSRNWTQPKRTMFSFLFSESLIRTAFQCLQLVVTDFLPTMPCTCLQIVVDVAGSFGLQNQELNISLTSIGLLVMNCKDAQENIWSTRLLGFWEATE